MPLPFVPSPDWPRGEDAGPPPTIRPSLPTTIATRATATAARASCRCSFPALRTCPVRLRWRATNRAFPAESPPDRTPAGPHEPPAACAVRWPSLIRKTLPCPPRNSWPTSLLPETAGACRPDPALPPRPTYCPPFLTRRRNRQSG